jgi:YbgC/YbaW family acyl-CoA thioester hydrolase
MFFDTDCAAVVHNIAYLRFIETARTLLAEQLGLGLEEMAKTQLFPVVARTEIDYKKPGTLGDKLFIDGWLESLDRTRFWCGFNVLRLRYIGTAVSCSLCGLASCAVLSMDGQVTPMFGMWVLLKGLTCALLGGLGSVRGVFGGAVLLGITEAHAQSLWGPIGREAATWGLLLLALLVQSHPLKDKFLHAKKV